MFLKNKPYRWLACLAIFWAATCTAKPLNDPTFFRSFWTPQYEGLPLSYCLIDGTTCGLKVATAYCRWMGYEKADHSLIAYNLGLTRYFPTRLRCDNWQCHGFKTIRCVGQMKDVSMRPNHYRKAHFVVPRYLGNRVDWCEFGGRKKCGRPAAFSFCRRLGYMKTIGFAPDAQAGSTEAIGNQRRCFGLMCKGFRYIDCYR
ncbi:MAG: hypothetical protein NTW08_06805 [Gammaproteobacteria bacterium]|nr:hypothetical protein [Gammaproteobacteria bacterium]